MLNPSNIGIIADDLTGACDIAACFACVNKPVSVFLCPENAVDMGTGFAVINTQTRLIPTEQSRRILYGAGKKLEGKTVILKKIDTALRGSVGAEIQGLAEALGEKSGPWEIIVAPAIPEIGKITRGGLQYDNEIPIHQTDYADDLSTPVSSANIAEVIARTSKVKVEVCDAETDNDLKHIVTGSLNGTKTVFVGSLGLANALAEQFVSEKCRSTKIPIANRPMVVCGSQYERAHVQIEKAAAHVGANVNYIHPNRGDGESDSLGKNQICFTCLIRQKITHAECSPSEVMMRFISIVTQAISKIKPDGLAIVGGETAYHLLNELGAKTLTVYGRISDVISYGIIEDGEMAGRPFLMKGGSVGTDDSVIQMLDLLTTSKER